MGSRSFPRYIVGCIDIDTTRRWKTSSPVLPAQNDRTTHSLTLFFSRTSLSIHSVLVERQQTHTTDGFFFHFHSVYPPRWQDLIKGRKPCVLFFRTQTAWPVYMDAFGRDVSQFDPYRTKESPPQINPLTFTTLQIDPYWS